MVEFKIQLDESFVKTLGYKEIETQLQAFIQKITLQLAAQDILEDLVDIDLENDEEWKVARELAWRQEGGKYVTQY